MCNLRLKRFLFFPFFNFIQINRIFIGKWIKNIHAFDSIFTSLFESIDMIDPMIDILTDILTFQLFSDFTDKFIRILLRPFW